MILPLKNPSVGRRTHVPLPSVERYAELQDFEGVRGRLGRRLRGPMGPVVVSLRRGASRAAEHRRGAFTERSEFDRRLDEVATELKRLKAEGKAEAVERVSGVFHRAGYRAEVRARRSGLL